MGDWRLIFLENHLELVDRELERLRREASDHPDPDGFGLFDDLETLTGIGFLFCQRFVVGAAKSSGQTVQAAARLHSPPLPCGLTAIELICAAANLWKHEDEWPDDAEQRRGPWSATLGALKAAGVWSDDYKIGNLHSVITAPADPTFAHVHELLSKWSDALDARPAVADAADES